MILIPMGKKETVLHRFISYPSASSDFCEFPCGIFMGERDKGLKHFSKLSGWCGSHIRHVAIVQGQRTLHGICLRRNVQ